MPNKVHTNVSSHIPPNRNKKRTRREVMSMIKIKTIKEIKKLKSDKMMEYFYKYTEWAEEYSHRLLTILEEHTEKESKKEE